MKTTAPYVIRRSRPGMGCGLFAARDIAAGEFICEYTGKKIPTKVADELETRYLFELDKKWTIDGSPRSNIARYINHSCCPNVEAEIDEGDRILIHAIRDIDKGEEFGIDYGEEYFDEFIKPVGCMCEGCALRVGANESLHE